jgi:iron-sulfur cluster assembly protein
MRKKTIIAWKFRLINGLLWRRKKSMITVSPNAKDYISRLMSDQQAQPGAFVRVGVKSGGCSGLEYKLDFDTVQREGDQVFEDNGVKVVVDMKSLLYLYGTELDYSGGLNGKGLTFNNPNASRTCSCGESFSV